MRIERVVVDAAQVTWNYKHLANASKLALVERVCRECGYEPPRIATPSELMEA